MGKNTTKTDIKTFDDSLKMISMGLGLIIKGALLGGKKNDEILDIIRETLEPKRNEFIEAGMQPQQFDNMISYVLQNTIEGKEVSLLEFLEARGNA